jgi:hypothetical protein
MGTVPIALPEVPKPSLGELLKLIVLPFSRTKDDQREFADHTSEVVRGVVSVIDDLISNATESRTAEDFKRTLVQVFPQYFRAMRALNDTARIVIPKQTINRLSAEWFSELEHDFRNLGPSTFGLDLSERGLFTAWTLRKISDLAQEVSVRGAIEDTAADFQKGWDFAAKALWTRFHVDCLVKAMRDNKPIYPEVEEPIREGLRMAVNTYACIREWLDMRNPQPEPEVGVIEWTDEDEEFLADSTRDFDQVTT